MKKIITTFFTLVAILALVSPLYAAGDYGKESDKAGKTFISAEKLQGMKVASQTGEEIGEIKKVKLDPQSAEIKFVTISKGEAMGEETPVPLEAFRFDQQNEQLVLTINESKLDNAPQQANMSDDEFVRNLESHYGVAPAWEGGSDQSETDTRSTEENPLETEPFEPTELSEPGRYFSQ
ncbi:MAG: PRC-barrel domain-containing protein [Desulforhopalus sp.]